VEIDPGTHMRCTRLCPLETGVTETDSSSPSTSSSESSTTSKCHERKKYSKMTLRYPHLTSLHESIWDIVEFGALAPKVVDKDYDSDEAAQIRHFNSQATSILLASLCQDEYKTRPGRERPPSRYYIKKRPKHGPGRENPRTLAPHH
jgi:hypothetical protein